MTTLLIVDDHASFRAVVRVALSERFTIVAETGEGSSAIALARALTPDVVLLDVQLPDLDGFAVADAMAAQDHPPVVVLTSSRSKLDLEPLLRDTTACGFMEKERLSADALSELIE